MITKKNFLASIILLSSFFINQRMNAMESKSDSVDENQAIIIDPQSYGSTESNILPDLTVETFCQATNTKAFSLVTNAKQSKLAFDIESLTQELKSLRLLGDHETDQTQQKSIDEMIVLKTNLCKIKNLSIQKKRDYFFKICEFIDKPSLKEEEIATILIYLLNKCNGNFFVLSHDTKQSIDAEELVRKVYATFGGDQCIDEEGYIMTSPNLNELRFIKEKQDCLKYSKPAIVFGIFSASCTIIIVLLVKHLP